MKKHLRVLYGADDRFEFVRNTINVCKDYFDTIRVVNSGPPVLVQKFINLPPNVHIETLNFYCGDLEMVRNSFLYDVDIGDYVLWLDSDECPTQFLLDNIDVVINTCEVNKVNIVRFPFIPHFWNAGTNILSFPVHFVDNNFKENFSRYPIDHNDWSKKCEDYAAGRTKTNPNGISDRFFKKTHKNVSAITNFGGHGSIYNGSEYDDWRYVRYPICHYKPYIAIYQSGTTSVYFNPCINISTVHGSKTYLDSIEYKMLREFQRKTKVITQNDLCYKLYINIDLEFKSMFKQLCESPELRNSKLLSNCFNHWTIWSEKYDLDWKTPHVFCGGECCKYKDIQI